MKKQTGDLDETTLLLSSVIPQRPSNVLSCILKIQSDNVDFLSFFAEKIRRLACKVRSSVFLVFFFHALMSSRE